MASTSTNKQPLLVDNVLHNVVNVDQAINNGIDIVGTNTATLLVNAISSDGAIIEDIYAIARGGTAYDVNLYISTANDYLRPNEATFVGTFKSGTGAGTRTSWEDMPFTLVPVPQVGSDSRNRAFYVPRNRALWVARNSNSNVTDGPIIGAQGGYY